MKSTLISVCARLLFPLLSFLIFFLLSFSSYAYPVSANYRLSMHGFTYSSNQAPSPTQELQAVSVKQEILLASDGRFRTVEEKQFPGGIVFHYLTTGTQAGMDSADIWQWRDGTELLHFDAAETRAYLADYLYLSPMLMYKAQAAHPDQRKMDRDHGASYEQDFTDIAGRIVRLKFDRATNLVISATLGTTIYEYADFDSSVIQPQPRRITKKVAGIVRAEWQLHLEPVSTVSDADFQLPAIYHRSQRQETMRATQIAENTFRIDGAASGYHTAFVVGEHSIAVFDTPLNPKEGEKLRAFIEKTVPGKKINYVVYSHTHGDHIGGGAAFLHDGVSYLTGKEGTVRISKVLGAQVAGKTKELTGEYELDLGGRQIRIFPFLSTHASDMLIAYDPVSQIIFQGDLFALPEVGPIPVGFPVNQQLEQFIKARRLPVKLIVSVHGRSGTLSELAETVKRRNSMQ